MKDFLVGYSGFVGSNLAESHVFNDVFNSKTIESAFGERPELLVYAGVPAEMFLANKNPEGDYNTIIQACNNIQAIDAKKVVLISTVAVYPNTKGVDENTIIGTRYLQAYGYNRLLLEHWVMNNCGNYLIVRLPAIYGKNIKKNFIYDYIHIIPKLLSEQKYIELASKESVIKKYYQKKDNGYYYCVELNISEKERLKRILNEIGFTALNFTDHRSRYQFYPLKRLWSDIEIALESNLRCVNLVPPPVSIGDLYFRLTEKTFYNELEHIPFDYNIYTKYSELFNGQGGYIMSYEEEMNEVSKFIQGENGR